MNQKAGGSGGEALQTFDYVIIGGGSAGCVLANRLTEDGRTTVALLEAGQRATGRYVDMPVAMMDTLARPDLNWGYVSEEEPGLNGRTYAVMRGRALGGSSQINGMGYVRGDARDYDDWAAMGCAGWSYADILPYFRRAEHAWCGESDLRGGSGPLGISRALCPALRFDDYRAAARNAGYPVKDHLQADHIEGLTPNELTVDARGRRASTWRAYLKPALKRPNLCVITGAHVSRVMVEQRCAYGVEYRRGNDQPERLRARREVILSAGSFASPQILLLSGIGPSAEIRSAGIDPVHDLPGVGDNLREHQLTYMSFGATGETFADELRVDRALFSTLRWMLFGTGPFACNAGPGQLYCQTDPNWNRADIQISFLALDARARPWLPFVQKPFHGLTALVAGLRSDSRGKVSLRSADPADHPRILYNLLTERSDVERMIRGIRATRAFYATPPLADRITTECMPGPDLVEDDQLEEYLRANCVPDEHPVGTCRMGSDAAAVVDSYLKVRGIEGLRVVDASIMPTVPTGNTNAPTIMIAEKAADHIRRLPGN